MKNTLLVALTTATALTIAPLISSASVIGFLGNFDVINDTGKVAHGFEIDLEGLRSSDITATFGGPGRGFPTRRGSGPGSVERYGSPTISGYTNGAVFGTKITYQGLLDALAWDYGTPSGSFITSGDNCGRWPRLQRKHVMRSLWRRHAEECDQNDLYLADRDGARLGDPEPDTGQPAGTGVGGDSRGPGATGSTTSTACHRRSDSSPATDRAPCGA
jgi:hypothetical protein